MQQTCQNSLQSRFPCRSGLYLKHEPNVKTLLLDIKIMVSHMPLTVPSAAPIQISSSANQDHLKTGKSESNLLLCGENWLMELTKVHSSSQRLMLAPMSSASKIEETGLENRCSNLPPLEADKHLPLFAPELSVPVISPDVLQRVLSQANKVNVWWPLLRSSPFCLLACRGAFSAVSRSDGFYTLCYL